MSNEKFKCNFLIKYVDNRGLEDRLTFEHKGRGHWLFMCTNTTWLLGLAVNILCWIFTYFHVWGTNLTNLCFFVFTIWRWMLWCIWNHMARKYNHDGIIKKTNRNIYYHWLFIGWVNKSFLNIILKYGKINLQCSWYADLIQGEFLFTLFVVFYDLELGMNMCAEIS